MANFTSRSIYIHVIIHMACLNTSLVCKNYLLVLIGIEYYLKKLCALDKWLKAILVQPICQHIFLFTSILLQSYMI